MILVEYITQPGDRWDLICWKAYGTIEEITLDDGTTVNPISYIIRSNPDTPVTSVLPEGLLLLIPKIAKKTAAYSKDLLPPWK